jgi:uncharacterized protein YecE (DUF72 family)
MPASPLRIGACSWNYASWVGLVYAKPQRTAAGYLPEYSRHFDTAEIDSWFYRAPISASVVEYKNSVGPDFRFTCKVPQNICLTHLRGKEQLTPNPDFLSAEAFKSFIAAIDPLLDRMDAIMLEFEYLNKMKMGSVEEFINRTGKFIHKIPRGLPIALEPRNGNYLGPSYFSFIKEHGLIHVFSEKQFMPHIWEIHDRYKAYIGSKTVLRLLGGDRKEMEEKTHEKWDAIVESREDALKRIAQMVVEMLNGAYVIINVNNHFEGSAPLTIRRLIAELKSHGVDYPAAIHEAALPGGAQPGGVG